MKKILTVLFFLTVGFSLFLASWHVINGDIRFYSDIARDFFLFAELSQKKIVLIGPRSSGGLFHGPVWTYLNYPAYILGNGSPVAVGWFWILLIVCFLISNFFVAKKLFNKETAYLFVLMTSVYMAFHAKGFFHPYGAMMLIPLSFFFFIRYIQTLKIKYLIIHVIIAGIILQFEIAVGTPLFILSFFYIVFKTIRSKKKKHLLVYSLLFLLISNFIIFNLKHDFILSKQLETYLSSSNRSSTSYFPYIIERIRLMFSGIEIIRADPANRNLVLFLISLFLIFIQIKDNKYKTIYFAFLYFYFGYFILSLINVGPMLYFYLFPIFPFVFLIFSSFITSRYKFLFGILFFMVLAINLQTAISDTIIDTQTIGKDINSWKFLYSVASKVYESPEKEFGYFVYSPDSIAYPEKYAMFYGQKTHKKTTYYFQKKPVTFLVIAPPPPDNPYMKDEWWILNKARINSKPLSTINFENGYKIEKYKLTSEEIKVKPDPGIDPGLSFR